MKLQKETSWKGVLHLSQCSSCGLICYITLNKINPHHSETSLVPKETIKTL